MCLHIARKAGPNRSHDRGLQPRADHLVPLRVWDNGVDEQPSAQSTDDALVAAIWAAVDNGRPAKLKENLRLPNGLS